MPSLVIKNFPKELHERLKASASRNRRSVTQEVLFAMERVYTPVPRITLPDPVKPRKPMTGEQIVKSIRRLRDGKR